MKRLIAYYSTFVIGFFITLGCTSTPSETIETPMKIGKITYSVEYVQPQKEGDNSPLDLKLSQLDLVVERTVYFDGNQSCLEETTDGYGIRVTTRQLRKKSEPGTFRYAESLSGVSHWTELQESRPANEEKVMSIVTFLKGEKTILGHRCKKATIEEEYKTYTVWYAEDLSINDPTRAIFRFDSIPGLIMEMDEALNDQKTALITRTRVTSIDLNVNEPKAFDLPKDAVQVKDIDELSLKNRQGVLQLMQKEQQQHPLSEEEKATFVGIWIFDYQGDQLKLKITKQKGDTYTILETKKLKKGGEETKEYSAVFYGPVLFVDSSPTFLCYRMTPNGDLKLEMADFFVFKKQS